MKGFKQQRARRKAAPLAKPRPSGKQPSPSKKRRVEEESDESEADGSDIGHNVDLTWPDDSNSILSIDELTDRPESIGRSDKHAHLPLTMNLQELQQDEEYADSGLQANEEGNVLPSIEFDDVDASTGGLLGEKPSLRAPPTVPVFSLPTGSAFSSRRQSAVDISEPIEHERIRTSTLNNFGVALGLWCEETGISRNQYDGLYEILSMLKPHAALNSLPESLTTLKRHTKGELPLLPMRKKRINLIPEKLSTAAEGRKTQGPGLTPNEDLVFFDMRVSFLPSILDMAGWLCPPVFLILPAIPILIASPGCDTDLPCFA